MTRIFDRVLRWSFLVFQSCSLVGALVLPGPSPFSPLPPVGSVLSDAVINTARTGTNVTYSMTVEVRSTKCGEEGNSRVHNYEMDLHSMYSRHSTEYIQFHSTSLLVSLSTRSHSLQSGPCTKSLSTFSSFPRLVEIRHQLPPADKVT